jgi:signal transduction histidine kinase
MAKILVIDDDLIIRQSLYDGLTIAGGYDVTVAEDGFEGVKVAGDLRPDLIICDIDMPGLDGYGVIEKLQEDPLNTKVPFIFLTGQSTRESMRQGMSLGADDYISKPFKMSELLEAVEVRLAKVARLEKHIERKLDALRDNILLALPHELRTPLSLIIGYAEMLADPNVNLPKENIYSMAGNILKSGRRLHHLIENYIIYAQIELILTEPERVTRMRQLREAMGHSIVEKVTREQMEKHGRSAQLSLNATNDPLPISTSNLEKIIQELVDNAFKFSPANTEITISADYKGGKFVFEVVNQGRGMMPDQIDAVGAYMQFERKLHEQQGSGMGLIVAKRLTELYGGTLTIQSTPDVATKVTVTLPA